MALKVARPESLSAGDADPMLPRLFRVEQRRRETQDTFTLVFKPAQDKQGFPFAPGQFNMLYAFGLGEAPISISGDPARPQTLVHTIRAVGAVTKAICQGHRGEMVGVRGPFGNPWPVSAAKESDVVIVAGGLGLAPLRPAIYQVLAQRDDYGNVELIYGARTPQDMLYLRELERWRGRFDMRVHVTVDAAPPGWRANVGVVTNIIPRARFDPDHTVALICGPGIMMRFTAQEFLNRGVKAENIFVSMERHMKCGLRHCGRCQLGPTFVCQDGPVYSYAYIKDWFERREI